MRTATESDLERPLPHNLDAERATLGASLLSEESLRIAREAGVKASDFFLPEHQAVWAACCAVADAGGVADTLTVVDWLERDGGLERAGGAAFVSSLIDGVPRVSNVEHYAAIVKRTASLRFFAHLGESLWQSAMERDANPLEVEANLRDLLASHSSRNGDGLKTLSVEDFLALEIQPREMILSPICPKQSLALLHSWRGVGKTYISLGVAYAVATGGRFLRWKAPRARGVLYVDGEMPATTLRDRIAAIIAGSEPSEPHTEERGFLKCITPDLQSRPIPDLATREGQAMVEAQMAGVEFLVLDNLSALCRTGKENERESWLPVQEWALRMRQRGVSVWFDHHDGKGKIQRGTSGKEDLLDTVLSLRHPADYSPVEGLRCEVHYEKCRGFYGDDAKPFEVRMETTPEGAAVWTLRDLEDTLLDRARELFDGGLSVREVAEALEISKSKAHRLRRSAFSTVGS